MRTLIISDLHEPPASALSTIEALITREAPDRTVFLGDYFDQFDDTPADAARTARWLKRSLAEPRRTHLIGNHDASYLWPCEATYCPGFTWEKENAIRQVLGCDPAHSFAFHTFVDDWLVTHAGLSADWIAGDLRGEILDRWLTREGDAARQAFCANRPHWFVSIGRRRGGNARVGGLLWCDHRELNPIPGVRQIYGHTPAPEPQWHGDNHLCLDTAFRTGPRYYAMVEDGVARVHPMMTASPFAP